ncbi:hypothetical protein SAMN04244548_01685 [Paracoccus pantotrophus]|nr:hypothetical protein SAMN04244548_01685 [Paracoccus pantotrophus]
MYGFAYDPGFIAFLPQDGEALPEQQESRLGQALAVFWSLAFLGLMVL